MKCYGFIRKKDGPAVPIESISKSLIDEYKLITIYNIFHDVLFDVIYETNDNSIQAILFKESTYLVVSPALSIREYGYGSSEVVNLIKGTKALREEIGVTGILFEDNSLFETNTPNFPDESINEVFTLLKMNPYLTYRSLLVALSKETLEELSSIIKKVTVKNVENFILDTSYSADYCYPETYSGLVTINNLIYSTAKDFVPHATMEDALKETGKYDEELKIKAERSYNISNHTIFDDIANSVDRDDRETIIDILSKWREEELVVGEAESAAKYLVSKDNQVVSSFGETLYRELDKTNGQFLQRVDRYIYDKYADLLRF